MFGSCLSKLDDDMLPLRFGFWPSNNTFYGISVFFKHNICLAGPWEIKGPWFKCLNLVLIPGAIGWPPRYLERVYIR